MTDYSEAFKANIVKKLLVPGGPTASSVATQTGVAQSTLSRWLRDARERSMSDAKPPARSGRRPSEWKPAEKLRILAETEGLEGEALGVILRRAGLHEPDLTEWRQAAFAALGGGAKGPAGGSEARRVRDLEKQLRRKDKALAEAAALLVLQKKVQAIWGDEDDDTNKEPDK
ncbi:MAG: transposase [Burkholderiales bacterium]|nr:transposase [Burkholderiales bacterium]